jgi:hypothetical protein
MRLTWPGVAALVLLGVPLAQAESPGPSQESARSEAKDDPLIGTWASKTVFGPALFGELTVTREGSRWQATLSGAESRFTSTGDIVRFAFPRNLGRFRGALTDDGHVLVGFWLQPSGESNYM